MCYYLFEWITTHGKELFNNGVYKSVINHFNLIPMALRNELLKSKMVMCNVSYLPDLRKYISINKFQVNEKGDTLSSDTCYHPRLW